MKTATKAALIVACSLLVAGLIICGIAYAWGGDNLGIIVSRKGITRASGQFIEKHVDTGAFHSITADMSLGTVRLEASDRYGVSYGYAPDYGTPACVVEGDQLRFTMEARNVFGINMLLHRPRENYVTIYYPQGAALGDVQLRANAGNVHIAGVTSDTLRVTADLGQVSLAQAQCGAVSLEMHAGDGKLTDVQANTLQADCNLGNMTFTRVVADSFHADADAGDIRLQDCRTGETELSCDLGNMQGDGLEMGALDASNHCGNIALAGSFNGDVSLKADLGNVKLTTRQPADAYRIDLEVSAGNCSVDGNRVGNRYQSGGAQGAHQMRIRNSCGNIAVHFNQM